MNELTISAVISYGCLFIFNEANTPEHKLGGMLRFYSAIAPPVTPQISPFT